MEDLLTDTAVRWVLAAGWVLQALSWLRALLSIGRGAAERREWPRELLLRCLLVSLVVWGLLAEQGGFFAIASSWMLAGLIVFLVAQAMAVLARVQLGRRWGIGTQPRMEAQPLHTGVYRITMHPIYWGMGLAMAAQAFLLQNIPSILLAAGALVVLPFKAQRETTGFHRLMGTRK
jgi:protein-S-isoprenylcysteine O-methyltransferase Ste14